MPTVEVLDSWLYYAETGAGPPVVFLHGNPTSSYLWRNILAPVARHGWRCIALDLIGMGKSGRPDSEYRFADHAAYIDGFVETLGLDDVILVGHDWGAVLALDHARRHPGRVRAVAFLEGHLHPIARWDDFDEGGRELFQRLRTPDLAERLILEENFFIEKVLPIRHHGPDHPQAPPARHPGSRHRRHRGRLVPRPRPKPDHHRPRPRPPLPARRQPPANRRRTDRLATRRARSHARRQLVPGPDTASR
jgi:pimeloyl-ACP methyl ester carboxylesterase